MEKAGEEQTEAILMPYIIMSMGSRKGGTSSPILEVIIGIYWTKDKQSIKTFLVWRGRLDRLFAASSTILANLFRPYVSGNCVEIVRSARRKTIMFDCGASMKASPDTIFRCLSLASSTCVRIKPNNNEKLSIFIWFCSFTSNSLRWWFFFLSLPSLVIEIPKACWKVKEWLTMWRTCTFGISKRSKSGCMPSLYIAALICEID